MTEDHANCDRRPRDTLGSAAAFRATSAMGNLLSSSAIKALDAVPVVPINVLLRLCTLQLLPRVEREVANIASCKF